MKNKTKPLRENCKPSLILLKIKMTRKAILMAVLITVSNTEGLPYVCVRCFAYIMSYLHNAFARENWLY